jgi:hypothetical protein
MKTLFITEGTEYEFGSRSMGYYVSPSKEELTAFVKEYNTGGSYECYYRCGNIQPIEVDVEDLKDILTERNKLACYKQDVYNFDKLSDIKINGESVKIYKSIQ